MFGSKLRTTRKLPSLPDDLLKTNIRETPVAPQRKRPYLVTTPGIQRRGPLRHGDSSFHALFKASRIPMGVLEVAGNEVRHIAANPAARRLFGPNTLATSLPDGPARGTGARSAAFSSWLYQLNRSLKTGRARSFRYEHNVLGRAPVILRVDVRYDKPSASVLPRFLYIAEDITEQVCAEEMLRDAAQQYKELYAASRRREQELALRDAIRTSIVQEQDLAYIIRVVVEGIAEYLGYKYVSLYLVKGENLELQHQVGYSSTIKELPMPNGIMGQVAASGFAVLREDVSKDPRYIASLADARSKICVPLSDCGKVMGVLNVESQGGETLGADDFHTIEALAESVSFALGQVRLNRAIRNSEERFQAFMSNSPAVAFIKDAEGRYVYVNSRYERVFAVSAEQAIGKTDATWLSIEAAAEAQENDRKVLAARRALEFVERVEAADGTLHHWLVYKFPIEDGTGQQLLGGFGIDISERKKEEADLYELAIRDELTGLYNRREMRRLLDEAASDYRNEKKNTALVLLDIDHFKKVNDNYGHKAGDKVLQWLAQVLDAKIEGEHTLARYGGEEFAIILPDTTREGGMQIAERLRREIEGTECKVMRSKGRMININVTVSLGVATFSGDIDFEEGLISAADAALYEAKRQGRNCAILFDTLFFTSTPFITTSPLHMS